MLFIFINAKPLLHNKKKYAEINLVQNEEMYEIINSNNNNIWNNIFSTICLFLCFLKYISEG